MTIEIRAVITPMVLGGEPLNGIPYYENGVIVGTVKLQYKNHLETENCWASVSEVYIKQ